MVFFLVSLNLWGQDSRLFSNLTRASGLSSNSVTSIVQDQKGFIWIGTKSGINKYDGTKYIHFHSGNSSLSSNDVTKLFVDNKGKLFAGFNSGGLYFFDELLEDFVKVSLGDEGVNATINFIYQHDTTSLWILSDHSVYDIKNQRELPSLQNIEKPSFTSMLYWGDHYWLGSNYGSLWRVDSLGAREEYPISTQPSGSVNRIYSLLYYMKDQLLVATQNNGVLLFNTNDQTFSPTDIKAEIIRDMMKDQAGNIWISTDGEGVFQLDSSGVLQNFRHQYGNENSIASNAVYCAFEDKQNNLWFGTAWDGISAITNQSESYKYYYSDFDGKNRSGVLSILSDSNRLWFGTDGDGVYVFPSEETDKVDIRKYLGNNTYPHFIKKMNDEYWIGTFKKGLFRFHLKNKTVINYKHQPQESTSLRHNDVRDIEIIEAGKYLVATWGGGLNIFDEKQNKFTNAGDGNIIPKNIVVLERLSEGIFLVGTFSEGLYVYNYEMQQITPLFQGKIKDVMSLYVADAYIWIGTWGEGLYKMSLNFDSLTLIENNVFHANTTILSILPDDDNGLFVSSNDAIYHLEQQGSAKKLLGQNEQFHINAAIKDQKGRYYFGSSKGVVSFTKEISAGKSIPPVHLLDIKLFDESLPKSSIKTDNLMLAHDQNVLTFEYGSLLFPSSALVEYMVMVEPLNTEWIKMGTQRSITLANLLPGTYHLKIKPVEGNEVTSFSFTILTPWWKTGWAILIYLFLFLLLLYSFKKYTVRLEKLRSKLAFETLKHEKEAEIGKIKQKFFINISHEIRTPLTLIIGEVERLISSMTNSKFVDSSATNIRTNSNYILQLLNELLDYGKLDSQQLKLHVSKGNFTKFSKEIFIAFQHFAESKQIQYTYESTEEELWVWFDKDQMEKVLFNLLSNAFKYTSTGGEVILKIEKEDKQIKIEVSDTGKGIPKEQQQDVFKRFYQSDHTDNISSVGFGIGLSIVHDIVKLHHGQVWVESELGKGSSFYVSLLLGNDHFSAEEITHDFLDSESIKLYTTDVKEAVEANLQPFHTSQQHDDLVLVVEDNPDIRRFICDILKDEFRMASAENGVAALEVIKDEIPDLIITDVMMPEMDGLSLLKIVKNDFNTSHIPIILLTARTGFIYKKEGYQKGADDYITKPFSTSILISRVRNLLRNRQVLQERIKNRYLTNPKEPIAVSNDDQFLIDLTDLVEKHLSSEQLDAGLITSELGVSHSVVYKKLKALTGFTIVEFIRDYRLTQAAKLLTTYHFTVAEACYKVGFSDKKYFTKIFKKKFNMTPSDYSRIHLLNNPE